MKTIKYFTYVALVLALTASSCSKETSTPEQQENQEIELEGKINGNDWKVNGADLPSANMRRDYESIELSVKENLDFEWKWNQKNGQVFVMTGYIFQEESSHKHENGARIWNLYLNVTHINGQNLPGGYYGIYSYVDENHLLLNVEPDVSNWGDHPEAEKGIGSGQNGNASVYTFTKQ